MPSPIEIVLVHVVDTEFPKITKIKDLDFEIGLVINYDDYFKSNRIFHWQSPNGTTQDSKEGIIFTKGTKPLHLFVRKDKKENMYFIYVGKVRPIYYDGNKPITIDFELEYELPKTIFEEMQKVKKI